MSENEPQVAVWTARYGTPDYYLFDNETSAADYAAVVADSGDASVLGAQFSDGRVIPVEQWEAYDEAEARLYASYRRREAEAAAAPKRAVRSVRSPFGLGQIEIEASEPEWLGER